MESQIAVVGFISAVIIFIVLVHFQVSLSAKEDEQWIWYQMDLLLVHIVMHYIILVCFQHIGVDLIETIFEANNVEANFAYFN